MKKTRSFLALTLSIIFIFSFSLNAFATNEDIPLDENGNFSFIINESENLSDMVKISEETVYVDDGSGNMVPVTVTRYRSAEDVKLYGTATSSFGARDLNPVVPVGTRDTLVITITNDQINNLAALTDMVKEAVLRIAANTASAQLGTLAVGLNIFARLCEITYWVNTELGNNGFKITINCIYEQHYIHSQGYYMYGWNITSATARTY